MPLFSVIIPTFHPGDKLGQTLDSVRAQGFDDLEIWVQDGASSDGTPAFLRAQTEVQWQSEADGGVYDAMNRAIARTSGDFVLFLGAGDVLRSGVLGQIAPLLATAKREAGEKPVFFYGDMEIAPGVIYDGRFTLSKLRTQNIGHQAIFYDRRLFERFGGYETRYRAYADHVFNLKCWGSGEVWPLYHPIVVADYEGGGLSDGGDPQYDRDRMRIVWRYLGPRQYVLALLAKLLPASLKSRLRQGRRRA